MVASSDVAYSVSLKRLVEASDFAHMCCATDLVAESMFLPRLEMHERRDMVVSACRDRVFDTFQ